MKETLYLPKGDVFHTGTTPSYSMQRLLLREDQEFLALVERLIRTCEICGAGIGERHGNSRYCVECGIDKHTEDCRERERDKYWETRADKHA